MLIIVACDLRLIAAILRVAPVQSRKGCVVMLNETIKKYRKAKGISQEELAVRLHVVRQTVSKWENGLSVPDAEVLINMSRLLEVPVSQLLGVEVEAGNVADLTNELARLNDELAQRKQKEIAWKRAGEKRGLILLLSFASLMAALGIKSPVVSIVLSGACILLAVLVLYRNMALLTSITTDDMRIKTLRVTNIVNVMTLLLCTVLAGLTAADVVIFTQHEEKMFALFLVSCVMIFAGIVSPRLPFTRHTGLRLPWTVQDQETWDLAHRVIGYISLPVALLYIACALTVEDFEMVTLVAMLVWIGVPGGISFVYFWKKTHGRL